MPEETEIARYRSPEQLPEGLDREILTVLIEECAEVTKRATKALRFGIYEQQSGGYPTNQLRLGAEIGDLEYVIRVALAIGLIREEDIRRGMDHKRAQLAIYLQNDYPDGL